MDNEKMTSEKYDRIILLLEKLVAIELFRLDVKQAEIGKHLGIATAKVNSMLKGIGKKK